MEEIVALLNDGLTKSDFEEAFKIVIDSIKGLSNKNEVEFDAIRSTIDILAAKLASENETDLAEVKAECQKLMADMMKEQVSNLNFIKDKVKRIKEGKDGKDGTPGKDGQSIVGPAGADGKDAPIKTPQEVRDELETLEGDERLDKSAVKGIEQIEENIKQIELRPVGKGGGGKGIGLYIGGSKKLLTAQMINLVAGTGISITYAYTSGRNDITISATGSGSFSVLAATGTINDANTVFTFPSTPSIVVVNGASYRNGAGVTIVTTTATLDNPVGVGGDIYGVG